MALHDPTALQGAALFPKPVVIPAADALPSLVTEVLHPTAHWTGSFNAPGDRPATAPSISDTAISRRVLPWLREAGSRLV